ncbi:MAG TPA: type II and III secretion system protein family protein, partial [Tepidisphaeraceae bacterium]|nr:type II and III secretion system protein family protein [Tepidisphaeraceae bacterium]
GALIALLYTGAAAGADAPTQPSSDTAAAPQANGGRPSFVTDGLGADGSLRLVAGKGALLTTRSPYKRVSVGQPDIADVNTIGPVSVLVSAKKAGSTQLILWDDQDRSQVVDIVVDMDLASAQRQLKMAFPESHIEASALNDRISLRGQVPSQQVAEQAVEMVSAYGKVNNFLEISGGQQVMLQVRFAEVSKTASRDLGVNFGGTDGVSAFSTQSFGGGINTFNLGSTDPAQRFLASQGDSTIFGAGRAGATTFDYFIKALRQNGLVRVLAEPNLVATSGQEASFLAGGQIPIPVPQPGNGGSTITIEYRDFGVRLNFTPQVLGNGRIRLKVSPEVSDLDFSSAVTVAGTSVPGFTDRKLNTVVELADGQSFALAGLLNNRVSANKSAIPFLGDIPVLGLLFRSVNYQRSETELVVIVTPRLVEAMNPDQVPLLPGEHWRYPDPLKFYGLADLGGPVVESDKAAADKANGKSAAAMPPPQFHGAYGYTPAGAGGAQVAQ